MCFYLFKETILPSDLVKRIVDRELLVKLSRCEVFDQVLSSLSKLGAESVARAVSQLESVGLLNEADVLRSVSSHPS